LVDEKNSAEELAHLAIAAAAKAVIHALEFAN
jgi:hypothetical protein